MLLHLLRTSPGMEYAGAYQVSYGIQGTAADNGTLLPAQTGTSYSFSGLNAGTN